MRQIMLLSSVLIFFLFESCVPKVYYQFTESELVQDTGKINAVEVPVIKLKSTVNTARIMEKSKQQLKEVVLNYGAQVKFYPDSVVISKFKDTLSTQEQNLFSASSLISELDSLKYKKKSKAGGNPKRNWTYWALLSFPLWVLIPHLNYIGFITLVVLGKSSEYERQVKIIQWFWLGALIIVLALYLG